MSKNNKHVIFLILSIFCIFLSFHYINSEKTILIITHKNKQDFIKELQDSDIKNLKAITRVDYGSGWNSGNLTIFYYYFFTEKAVITEGIVQYGNIGEYVRENGISADYIALAFFVFSLVNLIIFYI